MHSLVPLCVVLIASVLLLTVPGRAAEQAMTNSTTVLKWKGGKKAAFYLAFDDGCPTHLTNVIPALIERRIVGTFYPIAGNPNFKDNPRWIAAARSPYVVLANHTLTHKDFPTIEKFEQEIVDANAILMSFTPDANPDRLLSFGKPGGVKYGITDEQIAQVLRKHRLINRLPFWGPVIHLKTADDMRKYVDQIIAKREIGHLDFHGVGGDWLVTPVDFFNAILDKLDASRADLWIADAATLQKYAASRDVATAQAHPQSDGSLRIKLTSTADPTLCDEPLTLTTQVPAGWQSVRITQGESSVTVSGSGGSVTYDALPNGPEIVLHAVK